MFTITSDEPLKLNDILELDLYDFFDYCRCYGAPVSYIFQYLDKYTKGFESRLTQSVLWDFENYYECERENLYCDFDRIKAAIERHIKAGLELPLYPDVEFTPRRPQRENETDEQYARMCAIDKKIHEEERGKLNVNELLETEAGIELWSLVIIGKILYENYTLARRETETGQTKTPTYKICPATYRRAAVMALIEKSGLCKDIDRTKKAAFVEAVTGGNMNARPQDTVSYKQPERNAIKAAAELLKKIGIE